MGVARDSFLPREKSGGVEGRRKHSLSMCGILSPLPLTCLLSLLISEARRLALSAARLSRGYSS